MKKKIMVLLSIVLASFTLVSCNEPETAKLDRCDICHEETENLITEKIDDGIKISDSGYYWCNDWHFIHVCEHCKHCAN